MNLEKSNTSETPQNPEGMVHITSCVSYGMVFNGEELGIEYDFELTPEQQRKIDSAPPGMSYHFILNKYVPTEDLNKEMWVPIEETVLAQDANG